jgi:membrane protein required for colicin V production
MSALHFSYIDLAVALIVLISMIYAIWRGFVAETLSVFAWAAAAFAALYFAPLIAPHAQKLISPAWIGTAASYVIVFLVVLIPLSFISYRFAENVHNSPVGALDRSLGGIFGVVRGLAIVGIAYIVFSAFVPVPKQPAWVSEAGTLPVIQSSAQVILSLVPDQGVKIGRNEIIPALHETAEKSRHSHPKTYGAHERRALDKLIEQTGSGDTP